MSEAITWCAARFSMHDLGGSLRSPVLQVPQDRDLRVAVPELVRKRRELLQSEQQVRKSWTSLRLLQFYPDEALWDGTSQEVTGGFIDDIDSPPCDTWVHFSENALFSVVPDALESAMEVAFAYDPYVCMGWFGFRTHPLVDAVRAAGIVV